jgi:hypothetical protein
MRKSKLLCEYTNLKINFDSLMLENSFLKKRILILEKEKKPVRQGKAEKHHMKNQLENLTLEQKRLREISLLTSRLRIYKVNLLLSETMVEQYKRAIAGIIIELTEKGVFFEEIGKEKFK